MPTFPGSREQSSSWIVSDVDGSSGVRVNRATGFSGATNLSFHDDGHSVVDLTPPTNR
jgi:hypothetical protein